MPISTPASNEPRIKNDDPMYRLLRDGKIVEFNQQKARGITSDLTCCDFRGSH